MLKYTLVRHSGYVAAGNTQFEFAVELQQVTTKREVDKIEKSHGFVFDSYTEASDAEMSENYPADLEGMIPLVKGTFSIRKLQGAEIYVPPARTAS